MAHRKDVAGSCLLLMVFASVACNRVEVRINSFLSTAVEFPAPGSGTIGVCTETRPPNELFEAEVATAIQRLLEDHGYQVATAEDQRPDYVLACWFGADDGTTYMGTEVFHEPSSFHTTRYYTSWGDRVIARTYVPGSVRHVPYSYTVFQRRLALFLYKGEVPARTRDAAARSTLVWQATAESPGRRPDLRRTVPYLLVGAFEYWGMDSGSEQRETIRPKDDRVERLWSPDEAIQEDPP